MSDPLIEAVEARICWNVQHRRGITHCETPGCDKRSPSPDYAVQKIASLHAELDRLRLECERKDEALRTIYREADERGGGLPSSDFRGVYIVAKEAIAPAPTNLRAEIEKEYRERFLGELWTVLTDPPPTYHNLVAVIQDTSKAVLREGLEKT